MHLKYFIIACSLVASATAVAAPRLVLQITVDGLRGDLLERYSDNFSKGGFNYLRNRGVEYSNAHYLHSNTETIVGHTTLSTGTTPAVHGMIGNIWYDVKSEELAYNIEDATAPLLPTREETVSATQLDPAQKRSRSSGRSPRGILVPTFSDTLTIATGGKAKVFGISGKDRGAVAMAGKTGTAYWYSTDTGDFQSSSYYMAAYPAWVKTWNDQRRAEALGGGQWELLLDPARYHSRDRDERPYEVDLKGYGITFPHNFGPATHPLFFSQVLVSPEGDRLLLGFSKALMKAENIGQDDTTDYLSISFSSVDAVNHFFGPSSLENEDVVLQLDRTLEELLDFVDKQIGLEHTLVVLSSDHGMAEMPEYATELGYPAGRLFGDQVLELARGISGRLFGNEDLVRDFFRPYLYLDNKAVAGSNLDPHTVAAAIAVELERQPGIGGAIASHKVPHGSDNAVATAVRNNHNPQRAGDVYIFQQPYWFMFERGPVAAMHGSPWGYDTHVPILFVGPGIKPMHVHRRVHPIDIAPTLSALLNMPPPAAAQGTILAEVLKR